jgi:hypothetical protein
VDPALRADLEDVWTRHRKQPYASWSDLYSQWYKVSERKVAPHRGDYSPAAAKHVRTRIYLNVTAKGERQVYAWVQERIATISGVAAVKSGGPDLAAWARDVIVIYVAEDSAIDAVIQALEACPFREHFVDELVRSTRGVTGLPGVGIGDDPPDVDELREEYMEDKGREWRERHEVDRLERPSFSQYRAQLIFHALMGSGGDQESFRHRVIQGFREAGIDPRDPSVQGAASPSVVESLGLVTTKERIETVVTSTEDTAPGRYVWDSGHDWEVIEYLGPGKPFGPRDLPTYVYRVFRYQ